MISRLSVANLALVEKVEAEFAPGLTVITGETGAGKSVLIGALELVLGARADASVVRDGAKEAEIEAVFDGRCVRRTITREGRSRAWIDDESVSMGELRQFAGSLVDLHGPGAGGELLDEGFRRELLDACGGIALADYSQAYTALCAVRAEIEALERISGSEDIDYLRYQAGEIGEAALSEQDETLGERHAAAAHAGEIAALANDATEILGGENGVGDLFAALRGKFAALARHLPAAEEWVAQAEALALGSEELSRTVADAAAGIDFGEEDLDELDKRLTLVNRLKRKYRVSTVAELIAAGEEISKKLSQLEGREERMDELRREERTALEKTLAEGRRLSSLRSAAAKKLSAAVTSELRELGFLQAKFSVEVQMRAGEPAASGIDRTEFLFAPNPGEKDRPLADIASSGEIARVMLAVKAVAARRAGAVRAPTLVFDEIDANIGGETARAVGERLLAIAQANQVIAITHSPQSAVYGQRHLVVSKAVREGRTRTTIESVEGDRRVAEIARMLGGEKLTSVVGKHAAELLRLARRTR